MAWIESHQSLNKHRKVLRVAMTLNIDRHQVIGHLQELWWWALDNVPVDGNLAGLSNTEIAEAAGWEGDAEEFINALIHTGTPHGFIDDREGALYLHDWYEYAGKLLIRRQANTERMRAARARHSNASCETRAEDVRDTCATRAPATVPNRTVQNSTQNRGVGDVSVPATSSGDASGKPKPHPPPGKPPILTARPRKTAETPAYSAQEYYYASKFAGGNGRAKFLNATQKTFIRDLVAEVGEVIWRRAVDWGALKGVSDLGSIGKTARAIKEQEVEGDGHAKVRRGTGYTREDAEVYARDHGGNLPDGWHYQRRDGGLVAVADSL